MMYSKQYNKHILTCTLFLYEEFQSTSILQASCNLMLTNMTRLKHKYCRTGYIRPRFNFAQFAQSRLGEFKKWANKYKLITTKYYIFHKVMCTTIARSMLTTELGSGIRFNAHGYKQNRNTKSKVFFCYVSS